MEDGGGKMDANAKKRNPLSRMRGADDGLG
jgi:hypothetical protein